MKMSGSFICIGLVVYIFYCRSIRVLIFYFNFMEVEEVLYIFDLLLLVRRCFFFCWNIGVLEVYFEDREVYFD